MKNVINLVEQVFREKAKGAIEMPPKPSIHPRKGAFLHAMPAYIRELDACGCKWVGGFPQNHKLGLPYITGVLVLNDPETGLPICIMDCRWVTEARTAAVSVIAARYLAKRSPSVIALIGSGVQGRNNLRVLSQEFQSISQINVFDVRANAQAKVIEEMSSVGKSIVACSSPREAMLDADIVVTAVPPEPNPTIRNEWFKEGALGLPLEGDNYWYRDTLVHADKFVIDDYDQTIHIFRNAPKIHAELGEIIIGTKRGRENDKERIVSMNFGLAIADVATGLVLYKRAIEKGVGTKIFL